MSVAPLVASVLAAAAAPSRLRDGVEALGDAARAAQRLGPAAGVAALVVGAVLLILVGRFRRPIAAIGGALLGVLAAFLLRKTIAAHLGFSLPVSVPLLAIAGAAGGFAFPVAFPLAAGALPGALLGQHAPLGGRAMVGAAVGGALGGLVALLFARPVAIGFVSIAGGLLAALGAIALLRGSAFAAELAAHPFALLALALVAGIAGAAYQLERREPPPGVPAPPPPRDDRP